MYRCGVYQASDTTALQGHGVNEERSENKQRSTDISMTYGLASGLSTL